LINMLKEYIKLIIERENIVGFDFNQFKQLKTLPEQYAYAKDNLNIVSDEGQGRTVFDLGDKVLKVAKISNIKFANGVLQNKHELSKYKKLKEIDFVPTIYDYDQTGNWILSEKVSGFDLNDYERLHQYTDLYWDEMELVFSDLLQPRGPYTIDQMQYPEKYPELEDEILDETDFGNDWRNNPNIQKIFSAIKMGVGQEEVLVVPHYGTTVDNKLVLLDYGI